MTQVWSTERYHQEMSGKLPGKGGSASRAGRLAQVSGASFEADLDYAHGIYLRKGAASIQRLPVPTGPMPSSWLARKQYSGIARVLSAKQTCDYFGTHFVGGRAIYMEAKSMATKPKALRIVRATDKNTHGGTRDTQLLGLYEAARAGAIVAIVCRFGDWRGVFDSRAIAFAWVAHQSGTDAIPLSAAREFTLGQHKGNQFENWLPHAVDGATKV